jgi:signal-transduction protein with cAMP-binding, CBS, and nucleotidyltransferase domain
MVPKVRTVMTEKVCRVGVSFTTQMAAQLMDNMKIGSLLIEKEDAIVGIVTETDLVRKVLAKGIPPTTTPVGTVMSTPIFTIEANQSLVEANHLMERENIRHLVVVDNGEMVGVISVRDLLHPILV